MCENINQIFVKEKIKYINGMIHVEARESFLQDVVELLTANCIEIEDFTRNYRDFITSLNETLLKNYFLPEKKRKRYPIYKKFKNYFEFSLGGKLFKFEFLFNNSELKLVLVHFDRILEKKQITNWIEFFIPIFMLSLLFYFNHDNKLEKSQKNSLYILYAFNFIHIIYFLVLRFCKKINQKYNKEIWVNKSSIDLFRKLFRNRSIPDIYKGYYFFNWLNLWMLCLILLFIPDLKSQSLSNTLVTLGILLLVSIIALWAISYLLRIFSLNYWDTSLLALFIILVGFIGKDNWPFVVLVFVVVNQILSKELIYLTTNLSLTRKQGLERYLSTFEGRQNEIRMKFQTNVVILLVYLFLITFSKSRILKPILTVVVPEFSKISFANFFLTVLERFFVLFILYLIFRFSRLGIHQIHQIQEWIQILINYVANRLYRNANESVPIFKDELQLFEGESIEPEELISNLETLPLNIKVYWIVEPKQAKSMKVKVGVIYPDRTIYTHESTLSQINNEKDSNTL